MSIAHNPPTQPRCHDHRRPEHRPFDNFVEAVMVCVNYADFLEHTVQLNRHHFDSFVVVTHFDDRATHRVCDRHGLTCVKTDEMYHQGDDFNKGVAINLGLARLRHTGWVCHLDADIILPNNFRNLLRKSALDHECIYGADRINVPSFEEYEKLVAHSQFSPQHQWGFMMGAKSGGALTIGPRLVHDEIGYCPIGYFQLWHSDYVRRHRVRYPINQGNAEHSDVTFAAQWPRQNRRLLPTMFAYHLESEPAKMGANWSGRKTKPFARRR